MHIIGIGFFGFFSVDQLNPSGVGNGLFTVLVEPLYFSNLAAH
jgi:hypothetical protein